ncbi:cytochrome-c peroxidase [bacterium SCSIO 12643]|nr:cytochrome-c peroxidase [bacterium SCSIO 12643]
MKSHHLLLGVILLGAVSCEPSNTEQKEVSTPKSEPVQEVKSEQTGTSHLEALKKAQTFFDVLPDVAENPENPITPEKVALGKALYYDVILSKDRTISCNSCHNLDTYGVDNLSFSPGNDGTLGGRNSPSTLNAALHMAQFWDGREPDVEAQAGGPVLNPVEMAMSSEAEVVERLSEEDQYIDMFDAAFPEDAEAITYENMKKAIGAFERKLITKSRFDQFMHGDDAALTDEEVAGMETFISVGCVTCHSSATLGGNMYQKFGVYGDYWALTGSEKQDEGRFEVTQNEADKYMFKTPSLLNVAKTAPYFHDGSVDDLAKAIQIMGKLQLNKDLTDTEVAQIEVFLNALTGEVPAELKM